MTGGEKPETVIQPVISVGSNCMSLSQDCTVCQFRKQRYREADDFRCRPRNFEEFIPILDRQHREEADVAVGEQRFNSTTIEKQQLWIKGE